MPPFFSNFFCMISRAYGYLKTYVKINLFFFLQDFVRGQTSWSDSFLTTFSAILYLSAFILELIVALKSEEHKNLISI